MQRNLLMKKKCDKIKFDNIGAMLIIANAKKRTQKSFNRREKRKYYCEECKAWHTTSK